MVSVLRPGKVQRQTGGCPSPKGDCYIADSCVDMRHCYVARCLVVRLVIRSSDGANKGCLLMTPTHGR